MPVKEADKPQYTLVRQNLDLRKDFQAVRLDYYRNKPLEDKKPLTRGQLATLKLYLRQRLIVVLESLAIDQPTMATGQKIGRFIKKDQLEWISQKPENKGLFTIWQFCPDRGARTHREHLIPLEPLPDHIVQWIANRIIATQYVQGAAELVELREQDSIVRAIESIHCQHPCHSCMTGRNASYYRNIAEAEQSGLLTYQISGEIVARGLIWHHDNTQWIDRIYPNHDSPIKAQFLEAIKAKYPDSRWREHNSLPEGTVCFRRLRDDRRVTPAPMVIPYHGSMPYMDSFHYVVAVDTWNNTIELSTRDGDAHEGRCSSTFGDIEGYGYTCSHCSDRMSEDEAYSTYHGDYLCSDCVRHCEYCDEAHNPDESQYSQLLEVTYCDSCHTEHVENLLAHD